MSFDSRFVCALILAALPSTGFGDDAVPSPAFAKDVRAVIETRCLDCHDAETKEGGLDLSSLKFDADDSVGFGTWVKVHDRVEKGEMPPELAEHPTDAERAKLVATLAGVLTEAGEAKRRARGRGSMRRLNRVEYEHTLQDVLALPNLQVREMLPPDGVQFGFDKSAGALDLSRVHVARLVEAADDALSRALTPSIEPPERRTIRATFRSVDDTKASVQGFHVDLKHGIAAPMIGTKPDRTLVCDRGDFAKRDPGSVVDPEPRFDGVAMFANAPRNRNMVVKPFKVAVSGRYVLRVTGFGVRNEFGEIVPSEHVETVGFYADGERLLGRCDVPPNEPATAECEVWLNAGEKVHVLAVSAPNKEFKMAPTARKPFVWHRFAARGICFQTLEMEGPIDDWPTESHRLLFGDLPLEPTDADLPSTTHVDGRRYEVVSKNPARDAERLLRAFLKRALRRPTTDDDLAIPLGVARTQLDRGETFTTAMLAAYRAVLVSPDFLLLTDAPENGAPAEAPGDVLLDDFALASRLSYFLWNSPPDAELRRLAAEGRLQGRRVLFEQVDRMLEDPRADRFVAHYLDYWLGLRWIGVTEPDENLYPEYNELLGESSIDETRAFFKEMLRRDLRAGNVVDSDFLTINGRLAELYGVEGVQGSEIRVVPIDGDSLRGGFVTQASVLRISSNGTTTSPVYRGLFVQGTLLGDHPPPPPPEVPAVEPDISGATTIREQLAAHREIELCASCHRKIDPPGFALEAFDVIGAHRDRYRSLEKGDEVAMKVNGKPVKFLHGLPVDSAGEMTDGRTFEDIGGFRTLLVNREHDIAEAVLEPLVTYATGAPIAFSDRAAVHKILKRSKDRRYGLRTMIHELVQSDLFRKP